MLLVFLQGVRTSQLGFALGSGFCLAVYCCYMCLLRGTAAFLQRNATQNSKSRVNSLDKHVDFTTCLVLGP